MFRIESVMVAVFCGILLIPAPLTAQEGQIKDYKGQAIQDRATLNRLFGIVDGGSGILFKVNSAVATVPVNLKEGQKITFSVVVVGEERNVALALLDPAVAVVKKTTVEQKSAQLEIKEAPVTGRYVLVILSDKIGGFTLNATGPGEAKLNEKQLLEKIKRLKQELKETEEQLESIKKNAASKE